MHSPLPRDASGCSMLLHPEVTRVVSLFGRLISWRRFASDVTDVTGFLLRDLVVLHGTLARPDPTFPGPTHLLIPLLVQCMIPPYRRRAGQESPSVWRGRQRRFLVVYARRRGGQFSQRDWRRLVVRVSKAGGLSHDCRTLLCNFVTPCAELLLSRKCCDGGLSRVRGTNRRLLSFLGSCCDCCTPGCSDQ